MKELTNAEALRLIAPAPFALLSSLREDGVTNLMAVSWWCPLSSRPLMIGACLSNKGLSGSLIRERGEFALNIVGAELKESALKCGSCSGRSVDKAREFGIALEAARQIGAQVVSGSRAVFECRLESAVPAGDHTFYIANVAAAYGDADVDQLFAFEGYRRLDVLPKTE